MLRIAAGIVYLHEKGVTHEDLEPHHALVKVVSPQCRGKAICI